MKQIEEFNEKQLKNMCKIIVDVSLTTGHLKMRGAKPKKLATKKTQNGKEGLSPVSCHCCLTRILLHSNSFSTSWLLRKR